MQIKKINNNLFFSEVIEFLSQGKEVRIRVRGQSMLPFLDENRDEVIICGVDKEAIKIGTIVLAHIQFRQYIMHRVVAVEGENLVLMGDGNIGKTEKCVISEVIAIAKRRSRKDKEIDLISLKYRVYAKLWFTLRFIRKPLLVSYKIFTQRDYLKRKLQYKMNKI